jgi:hypothetical protein
MVAKSKKSKAQTAAKNKVELLFSVGKDVPKWYLLEKSLDSTQKNVEHFTKGKCEQLYRAELDLYQLSHQQEQTSDYQWLQTSLSTTAKVGAR